MTYTQAGKMLDGLVAENPQLKTEYTIGSHRVSSSFRSISIGRSSLILSANWRSDWWVTIIGPGTIVEHVVPSRELMEAVCRAFREAAR